MDILGPFFYILLAHDLFFHPIYYPISSLLSLTFYRIALLWRLLLTKLVLEGCLVWKLFDVPFDKYDILRGEISFVGIQGFFHNRGHMEFQIFVVLFSKALHEGNLGSAHLYLCYYSPFLTSQSADDLTTKAYAIDILFSHDHMVDTFNYFAWLIPSLSQNSGLHKLQIMTIDNPFARLDFSCRNDPIPMDWESYWFFDGDSFSWAFGLIAIFYKLLSILIDLSLI